MTETCLCFKEVETNLMSHDESNYLTMPEKRSLLENVKELLKFDALTVGDRNRIYMVCYEACDRELRKGEEKK